MATLPFWLYDGRNCKNKFDVSPPELDMQIGAGRGPRETMPQEARPEQKLCQK
jgi:hypothetical protein